VEKKDGTQ
jgi:hypothetical protein